MDKGRGFIELKDFLQGVDFTNFFAYEGSLMEPPCYEGIKWIVINQVQYLTKEQLARFSLGHDPEM